MKKTVSVDAETMTKLGLLAEIRGISKEAVVRELVMGNPPIKVLSDEEIREMEDRALDKDWMCPVTRSNEIDQQDTVPDIRKWSPVPKGRKL
jgi:hypothetical protein